ncbi:TPA: hypothetical protein QDC22_007535 [Burkholderia stabilis]|nr:hypothetical protein [Burkholderia stabilis]HDR9589146.1 hypothetical protein [Burkholderia stabilis]HDR9649542.1 hypothetical protein [Burkholderia stabilis]HDR9653608.1 hypothetical protein [Burkholderia stabilis]HDR9656303.1 hypothetical protein [Burkholderia stabilis]
MDTTADSLLQSVTTTALNPALKLLPPAMDSAAARVLMLAIGLQESGLTARRQLGNGPARGLWQFELGSQARGGGVWGVFLHDATREQLRHLCDARKCAFSPTWIYSAIEIDDVLAAGLARLLIFTDRAPLPAVGDVANSWTLYAKRTWVPGKPRPGDWPENYFSAVRFVQGTAR